MKNLSALILLLTANIVSGVAQGISMIAIPWYFNLEGKMSWFALIFLLTNVVSLFWVPYSGILVDKYDRKKVFLAILTVSGVLVTAVAAYGQWQDGLGLFLVGSVFTITFLNYNIHFPTLYAFLQEITEKKHYGKISSIIEVQGQFATIVAGAVGALLLEGIDGELVIFGLRIDVGWTVAAWGIEDIFTLDAATYMVAILLVASIRYLPLTVRKVEIGSLMSRFAKGWSYLKAHRNILVFGIASYSVFLTVLLSGFYLLAPYVYHHLDQGADVYSNMDMFYGLGAIMAGFFVRTLFAERRLINCVIFLTVLMVLSFLGMIFTYSVPLFFVLAATHGICNAGVRVMRVAYLFKYVPNEVYGRAASIFALTNISGRIIFLGLFMILGIADGENVIYAMAMMIGFLVLTILVFLYYYPHFHKDLVKEI